MSEDEQHRYEQLCQELEHAKRSVEVNYASFRRNGYEVKLYQGFFFFLLAAASIAAIASILE
jgi:hypothetical protein